MEEHPAVIWLVGGKKADSQEHKRSIEQAEPLDARLVALRERVEDYTDLATSPLTGAVLISDSIWKKSGRVYSGADVATYLRTLRPELPIYLLSDDDEDTGDGSFDGVISAKELRKRPEVYTSRLLRAVGRYKLSLDERQQRLQTLLDRQTNGSLTLIEGEELDELRAFTERPAQVSVAKQAKRLEFELAEKRNLVRRLEALAERLEHPQE